MTTRTAFTQDFGRRLRAAMVLKGMSTGELAEAMGTTQFTVQRHMRGDNLPDLEQLCRYSALLGADPNYLLPRDEWAPWDSNPQPTDRSAESDRAGEAEAA